jgi:sensor c-di-GMP phosphodiesterase-like protein
LDWRPVPCPKQFVEEVQIGAAFGAKGPVTISFSDASLNNSKALRLSVGADRDNVVISDGTHKPLLQGLQHWPRATFVVLPALLVMGLVCGMVAARRRRQPAGFDPLVAVE